MNLLVSHQWLKEFVASDLPAEEFARRVSLCGPAIERMHAAGHGLEGIVVGRISEIRPHPNADKLRVTLVDVGKELLEIVCGGSNLAIGQAVAVATIGSQVRWHGEGEPIVLAEAEIRGVKSFGMIAAANELGLGEVFPHAEREILDLGFLEKTEPGTPLADALGLHDMIFDIEVTTNRPDALSTVGMAREAATILGVPFEHKQLAARTAPLKAPAKDALPLDIAVEATDQCSRYQAVVVHGVQVGPSPWWIRRRLAQAGIRSVSNVVDITNYVMLELGHPLHAFNYHALEQSRIVVRRAKPGEQLLGLDEVEYAFTGGELIIADAKKPVAIAGIMGGAASGITPDTTTVVLEAAAFDPVTVRRTARGLHVQSESSLRFEKGLSAEATTGALARATRLLVEVCGAKIASQVRDERSTTAPAKRYPFRPAKAAELIGVAIPAAKQITILKSLGFGVTGRGAMLEATVPWWREHDIESERDLTEEVARIWGYHNLPSELPPGLPPLKPEDPHFAVEDRLRDVLKGVGCTEIMSYSMISEDLLRASYMHDTPAVALQNPLTQELALLRTDLLPSMLKVISENHDGQSAGALFEVANVYLPREDALPTESARCLIAVYGPAAQGESFFRVKGMVEHLLGESVSGWEFDASAQASAYPKASHPGRRIAVRAGDESLGYVAEIHPDVLRGFGINTRVAVASLNIEQMVRVPRQMRYTPPPPFPAVKRDVAFFVDRRVTHAQLLSVMNRAHPLVADVVLFDVFMGKDVPADKKSVAYHVQYRSADHTLTSDEAEAAHQALVDSLEKKFKAEVRE